jgi:hypothetical protein
MVGRRAKFIGDFNDMLRTAAEGQREGNDADEKK